MKIWIASDSTRGRMYTTDTPDKIDPVKLAYVYGRAETGEIIHIWTDDDTSRPEDYALYWDNRRREYRRY